MSKLLKLSGAAYCRLKTSREVTLRTYTGYIDVGLYEKKTEK